MKKTYINPSIYVRKVVANNILAGSPLGSYNLSSSNETNNEEGATIVTESKQSTWGLDWGE